MFCRTLNSILSNTSCYGIHIHVDSIYHSVAQIHISIKFPIRETKDKMWYNYYSGKAVFELWSFSVFIHKWYLFILPQTTFSWIRVLIKAPHTTAPAWYEFQSLSVLCDCVTDRLTLIVSPCPSVTAPTVSWQAWPGQITEQNMVSCDHKDRTMTTR